MATPTYDLLDSTTLASSAASVTFSGIDQSYGDLILVFSGTLSSQTGIELDVNGVGTFGSRVFMFGNGTSATSGTATNLLVGFNGVTRSDTILHIFDYSATDKHKTMLFRNDNIDSGVSAQAQRWASTAAITSLELDPVGGVTIEAGTTISLFGVAK